MSGTAAGMSGASSFQLDARLAADSVFVADGPLSQVRLMDDSRFPWLVLVPRVADVSEWIDLDGGQQRLLLAEINQLSQLLRVEPGVAKLNIGALGNIVRQLHVHLVGRHPGDAAWPGPVWGSGSAQRFEADALRQHVAAWAQRLR
ncbi:HIT family protein [Xanthomonas arboricola]|uniref:HIT domain-containing protein n=1 Tax=Xanthomonas arboricola TaxID=56448 RepID=UPI0004D83B1D|nr:diadenosine tetraphosphate hydrolase [Xanthomonas arboricola pv. celebensis]NJB79817.1 diadenosine tetraphosphate (Ap4A) HIT family hydrolase [Xanthomonas arboricola]